MDEAHILKGEYKSGITKRIAGFSDEMMHRQCEIFHNIIFRTKEKKVGRGRAAHIVKTRVYESNNKLDAKTKASLTHYKELMEKPKQIKFRDYQEEIISKGTQILMQHGFLYLAMEVRTGKTLTSMGISQLIGCENVLFITKKKAISSIENDFNLLRPDYNLVVINYESLHKVDSSIKFDVIICDEAHSMGAYPKPSKRARAVRDMIKKTKASVILLSGTPTPESYSQMYHQVYAIPSNPFNKYASFYKFAKDYVIVKQRKINGLFINEYKNGLTTILDKMKPYTIAYTQKEAGFKVDTREHVLEVEMSDLTHSIAGKLKKNLVVEGKEETILGDTPVKLMMKLHQIYSGTVKFESGNSKIIDLSKAKYIHDNFADAKIGIFYKFKEELNALMEVYGKDSLTTELSVFEDTDKSIALQIVSGREGISLRQAEALVYYNIDFSATSYWQSRDRMTTKDRLESDVYWVFAKGGIERDIYKAVSKKKDYTVNHFKKDLLSL
jgi:hypothetical protein